MSLADLWAEFVKKAAELDAVRRPLLADHSKEILPLIRNALKVPHLTGAALDILGYLSDSERLSVLDDLARLASSLHRYTTLASSVILSLPRAEVMEKIESVCKPILKNGTEEEFSLLMALYEGLDIDLAAKLARWGVRQSSPDIQEPAAKFLTDRKISTFSEG